VAASTYAGWIAEMTARAHNAIEEGDLRDEIEPSALGETVLVAMLGAELLSNAMSSGADVLERVARTWEVLLPAIVTDDSLAYFREFLKRESMRRAATTPAE